MSTLGAILLAGGRGSRMGGVSKPLLEVGGMTLLDAALRAARDVGADPIIVVGPPDDAHAGLTWVREDPPFGGPAAAIMAAAFFASIYFGWSNRGKSSRLHAEVS